MGDVLIVEDEAGIQAMLAMALGHDGIPCRTAEDALEALQAARAQWPDLVLLDMNLPDGVDGWAVWEQLEQLAAGRPVRVVLYTSAHDAATCEAGRTRGALDVLSKALPYRVLTERLRCAYRRATGA